MLEEKFKPFIWKGVDTGYSISENGVVIDNKGHIRSDSVTKRGYHNISLRINKKPKTFSVHRMVALTYIPNPDNKPQVNHIDGNKSNNSVSNLEWVTNQENLEHAIRTGLKYTVDIPEDKVREICQLLESKHTVKEIVHISGIPRHLVRRIKEGTIYTDISKEYDIPYNKHVMLSPEIVDSICKMKADGISKAEISRITNVNVNTINGIFRSHGKWFGIVNKYVYTVDPYNQYNHLNDLVDEALLSGIPINRIITLMGTKFSEEQARLFINRRRAILIHNGHPELRLLDSFKWKHLHDSIDRMLIDGIKPSMIYKVIGIDDNNIHNVIYKRLYALRDKGQLP